MNKNSALTAFLLLLAVNSTAQLADYSPAATFSKPLLMPALALFVWLAVPGKKNRLFSWLLAALFFSWGGDLLLMFQGEHELFFLGGLVSFLLAHICYVIIFFTGIRQQKIPFRIILALPVVLYYAVLMSWLFPFLSAMRLPVFVYGAVISLMFGAALQLKNLQPGFAGNWLMAGAGLFVLSDSLLAANKFVSPLPMAGFWIMLTYGLAQLLIVKGLIEYLCSLKKN